MPQIVNVKIINSGGLQNGKPRFFDFDDVAGLTGTGKDELAQLAVTGDRLLADFHQQLSGNLV